MGGIKFKLGVWGWPVGSEDSLASAGGKKGGPCQNCQSVTTVSETLEPKPQTLTLHPSTLKFGVYKSWRLRAGEITWGGVEALDRVKTPLNMFSPKP